MKKNNFLSLTLFILTCFYCLPLSAEDENFTEQNIEELKQSITKVMEQHQLPAVGIAMVNSHGPVWVGALGKANLEKDISADENTLFRIASTSKMFVSLSILKLVEQGRLKLTDRLSELAPEIAFENAWEETNPIQLVHLLEHTTGWDEQHYPEFAHNDPKPIALKKALDFHPHSRSSRWVPGSRYAYNNTGPSVAAYIVEKFENQSYEKSVQENFFNPIDMKSATFYKNENFITSGATGYNSNNQPLDYMHLLMRPAGAINATPEDMANLLAFYLGRGRINNQPILSSESIDRMEQVESTTAAMTGQQTGYGLSNYSSAHGPWVYREHNGGLQGALSEFAYLPKEKLGHAILINSDNYSAFVKISNLIRDFETKGLIKKPIKSETKITREHRAIEGLYYPVNPRVQKFDFIFYLTGMKTLSFEGDTLVQGKAIGESKNYFNPVSASAYRSQLTGLVSISKVMDPLEGEVIHLAYQNSATKNVVLKRINPWFGYFQLITMILWALIIISSFIYFIIWSIRKLTGKLPSGASITVRVWPLLASTAILVIWFLLLMASSDPYGYMAKPTWVSVGVMLMTILFACLSIISVISVYRARRAIMNRCNYWYCTLSSITHFAVALNLLYFGLIGIVFWD